MSAEHWDRLMRVNLLSHIQFTRELLPSLLARREAHVLNVCSMFGLVGMPKVTAYCTSKFGMVGFSEVAAQRIRPRRTGRDRTVPGFRRRRTCSRTAPLEKSQNEHKLPPRIICTTPEKRRQRGREGDLPQPPAGGHGRRSPGSWYATKRFVPWLMDFIFHLGRRKRVERKMAQLKQAA